MKKLMLSVMVMFMAVAIFATGEKIDATSLATVKDLIKADKIVEAKAFLAGMDWSNGEIGNVDWIPVAVAVKNYFWAQSLAFKAGDKVGQFKYAKLYLLENYQELPNVVTILDRVGSINFEDTEITPEMQLKFLQSVNQKYIRFLTVDPNCPWLPVITALQQRIKVMKEDMAVK